MMPCRVKEVLNVSDQSRLQAARMRRELRDDVETRGNAAPRRGIEDSVSQFVESPAVGADKTDGKTRETGCGGEGREHWAALVGAKAG